MRCSDHVASRLDHCAKSLQAKKPWSWTIFRFGNMEDVIMSGYFNMGLYCVLVARTEGSKIVIRSRLNAKNITSV